MPYLSRICLLVAGLTVSLYVLALFWQVEMGRQIGVDCLLSSELPLRGGATISHVDLDAGSDLVGQAPVAGDRIVKLGEVAVDSPLKFKRELNLAQRGIAAAPPNSLPQVEHARDLARLSENLARVGTENWVRLGYVRSGEAAARGQVPSAWLRLRPAPRSGLALSILWTVLGMSLLALGIVVVLRRPGDPSAAMFCAFCAVSVVAFLGTFHWSSLVGNRWLIYPLVVCGLLLAPLMLHLYLLFPRPLPGMRRWPRLTLTMVYLPVVVLMVLFFVQLTALEAAYQQSDGAAEVAKRLNAVVSLIYTALALSLVWFLTGIGVLLWRLRSAARGARHGQVQWLLGGAIATLPPIGYLAYVGLTDRAAFAFGSAARWMIGVTCLLLVATHALGLTRYKLVPLGQFAFRALWYLVISCAATALYCLLVELLVPLVGRRHFHWLDALVAALTALTLVVVLGWFRDRFQRGWDRRYLVYKHQLDKAVRRLSAAVDQLVETSQLAKQMLQSARDVVAAERGAVYLLEPEGTRLALSARVAWPNAPEYLHNGSPLTHELHRVGAISARIGLAALPSAAQLELRDLEAELAFALERENLLVGLLVLGPKADGTPYSNEERSFLAALARTTTLALRSAEENRTIERLKEDLHDKVSKIAEQQQRITFLQGQLLKRAPAERLPPLVPTSDMAGAEQLASEIRGSSAAVREMLEQVRKIAVSPSSVLIRGESGTGKELLAQAIHRNSPRAKGPFVAVHCAALSPGLLEAELFGHVKGAFTGADRDRPGRFELAHGGTLLLDEIGDIALDTQIKLLRVLQERSFERVGSSQRVQVDVRLIAATHQDLEALIRRGKFREDLFYRLNVISVRCPPLRERRDDIFELAVGFLENYAHRAGKHLVRIEEEALDVLMAYDWPGNVRELENTIERAVVLAEGEAIGRRDLPLELVAHSSGNAAQGRRRRAVTATASLAKVPLRESAANAAREDLAGELSQFERQRLLEVLAECDGNKSRAARKLGIPRSTLFSKLAKLGAATPR